MKDELICENNLIHKDKIKNVKINIPSDEKLSSVAELFNVFGDLTRTKIIASLFYDELCVCDISNLLNISISAVSHQLRILRNTKLVKYRKVGKEVYYSLDDEHILSLYKLALEHVEEE